MILALHRFRAGTVAGSLIACCFAAALPLSASALPSASASRSGATIQPELVLPQYPALRRRGARRSRALRQWHGVRRMVSYPTQIQHVVVIDMENRTVDNLFAGYYGQPWRGGPTTWDQVMSLYNPANPSQPLRQNGFEAEFDPHHGHNSGWLVESVPGGFANEHFGCQSSGCPVTATAYSYVPTSETGPYAQLVQNYASADNVYQANEGPSFVSHQYLIAAQSGGISSSYQAESENPGDTDPPNQNTVETGDDPDGSGAPYCSSNNKKNVGYLFMNQAQGEQSKSNPALVPCETYGPGTILDAIASEQGIPAIYDWQYISHQEGGLWSAPMAVQNLYQAYNNAVQQGTTASQSFAVDANAHNFVNNLQGAGDPVRPFAALTYITPCPNASDHADASGDNIYGPEWVGTVVNAIGNSQYWYSTAIVITWDDWGGWFDHSGYSSNPQGPWVEAYPNAYDNTSDPNEWGFRVPLMVISPYITARGYVSHGPNGTTNPRSQSAIMTLVEYLFGLPSLHGDDYYANDPLLDMFNFNNSLPFIPVTGLNGYKIPSTCS